MSLIMFSQFFLGACVEHNTSSGEQNEYWQWRHSHEEKEKGS
jgi:hypothetical protein